MQNCTIRKMNSNLLISKYILRILLLLLFAVSSCSENNSVVDPIDSGTTIAKIAVFSDPHYFDPTLGTTKDSSNKDIGLDRKMIAESEAILVSTINKILNEDANIVLIPGDLTKDGELQSHNKFAEHLKKLENSGAKVYVVPGNHDINNPNAMSYLGSEPTPVANTSPSEFAEIYSDYGYSEALYRDPNSLSYVAQPSDDIWIIGMDACRYDNNLANGYSETRGKFKPETYEWIKSKISEGISLNKTIFGMMHHGLTEHFIGQGELFSPYIVDDFATVRLEFAALGLKLVFTGHYHAQDIVKFTSGADFIFDIETGSSVTWPSPFRIMELTSKNYLKVTSDFISEIDYDTGGLTFQEYAKEFLESWMPELIKHYLINDYALSETNADIVAPIMTEAIMAHYAGDENPSQETLNEIQQLANNSDPTIQRIATGLSLIWLDLIPSDNNITINLNNGNVQ